MNGKKGKKMIIGIDVGAGDVKAYREDGKAVKFPTAIREVHFNGNGFNIKNSKSINYKGNNYIVGKANATNVISRGFGFFNQYTPLLVWEALKRLEIDNCEGIKLKIGFSYLYESQVHALQETLTAFEIDNRECKFETEAFIQGQGIAQLLKLDGDIAIYDVGFSTDDLLFFEDNSLVEVFSGKSGVHKMVTELQSKLNQTYELELSEHQVNRFLQDKKAIVDGLEIDLKDEVEQLSNKYASSRMEYLKEKYGNKLRTLDKVVFAGGGANYFKNAKLPSNTIIEPDEFANAKGYTSL
jgi:hypothetical protein